MINANELRIGNWIYSGEYFGNIQVKVIEKQGVNPFEWGQSTGGIHFFDTINPIPLTEKLLLEFGFKKVVFDSEETGYGTEYHMKCSDDAFMVYVDDMSVGIYSNEESYEEGNSLSVIPAWQYTKNVHQLQNLYFALTGKELEINL